MKFALQNYFIISCAKKSNKFVSSLIDKFESLAVEHQRSIPTNRSMMVNQTTCPFCPATTLELKCGDCSVGFCCRNIVNTKTELCGQVCFVGAKEANEGYIRCKMCFLQHVKTCERCLDYEMKNNYKGSFRSIISK
jgi:hypothetical protein